MIVGIATFLGVVEISCNRIACGIGGGVCCWGEAGCWRVTFFSLRGLLLVGAVQSSPCSGKTGQKGRFRVCWESFVPVGPPNWIRRESFVPGPPWRPPPPPTGPVGTSPGGRRGPGAWHEWSRPASRRSGSPVPPTRRPSRSSGTSERSRGR